MKKGILVNISGATCSHCKNSIEKEVKQLKNVVSVEVDLKEQTVSIEGENVDIEEVKKTIQDLGYTFNSML